MPTYSTSMLHGHDKQGRFSVSDFDMSSPNGGFLDKWKHIFYSSSTFQLILIQKASKKLRKYNKENLDLISTFPMVWTTNCRVLSYRILLNNEVTGTKKTSSNTYFILNFDTLVRGNPGLFLTAICPSASKDLSKKLRPLDKKSGRINPPKTITFPRLKISLMTISVQALYP